MTLYRTYRPQAFIDIVGQEHIKQTLTNAVERDIVSHAYLFTGPRGTGKTSTARILAKVLNCGHVTKDHNPCNDCDSCKQITEGSLIDIIEIDAASNRGIDEIRELKQTLQFQPSFVKNKIYIIDEVHMLTKEAFNALLKTLEEPPDFVYFVLATTEVEKIPETIISRCQRFDFRRLNEPSIVGRLKFICEQEKFEFDEAALLAIAKAAEGGLRDAISLLEQLSSLFTKLSAESVSTFLGQTEMKLCIQYIDAIKSSNLNLAMATVDDFVAAGYQLRQVYKDVMGALRNHFLESIGKDQQATQFYIKMITILEKNNELFQKSAIPRLMFEVTAAQMGAVEEVQAKEPAPVPQVPLVPQAAPVAPATSIKETKKVEPKREHRAIKVETKEPEARPKAPEVLPAKEPSAQDEIPALATGEINLREIKQRWAKVVDTVSPSSLRVSLKQAHIKNVANNKVELGFTSLFHFKQVNSPEQTMEIERAMAAVLGHKLRVGILEDLLELDPKIEAKRKVEDLVETAMDIFEGM